MSSIDRRNFIRRVASVGSGALFAPSLAGLAACTDTARNPLSPSRLLSSSSLGNGGYGPLLVNDYVPELLIPEGFRILRLSETRKPSQANNGFIVPQAFDGMAAFPLPNGNVRLIRNHEIRDSASRARPFGSNAYDARAGGGTTSLEVEIRGSGARKRMRLVAEYPSLTGTHVNCAGGPTPWGSWLSCEETTAGEAQGYGRDHGYVFEVPSSATGVVEPVPLRAMGRFVHEAVAVDPATGLLYETEDIRFDRDNTETRPGSGFYRFVPTAPGNLRAGGKLQMLRVQGADRYDTTAGQSQGQVLPATWVDIDDPDSDLAETDPNYVFKQGLDRGGAIFQRLEGCWYGDGSIFFNATSGGDAEAGQVWQYRPLGDGRGDGELILVFESPGVSVLDSPDNICVSPRGGLVVCEDGDDVQFIRGVTQSGGIFDFVQTNGDMAEFCGACFSPDGEVLFFNIQGSTSGEGTNFGATYAMWGPWERGAL